MQHHLDALQRAAARRARRPIPASRSIVDRPPLPADDPAPTPRERAPSAARSRALNPRTRSTPSWSALQPVRAGGLPGGRRAAVEGLQPALHLRRRRPRQNPPPPRGRPPDRPASSRHLGCSISRPSASRTSSSTRSATTGPRSSARKYRTIDLLLIDDIQFISGKERTQEEFFHTFNDLYESRKQIIVSCDSPPKEIPEIEERLRSRFEWGLIADIQPPDFETRVAILKKKAALERVRLADDVAYLIASRIKSNIRELEGSLTRMIAFCALTGREMTVDLAQEVLADLWGEDEKIITIEQIQRQVCRLLRPQDADIKAKNRTKAVAFPRQIAMYLSRQLTHSSLAEVGRAFGGKDHTTVLHAVDKIQRSAAGRPQTPQDHRWTYPGHHPVIHGSPAPLHTAYPRAPPSPNYSVSSVLLAASRCPHRLTIDYDYEVVSLVLQNNWRSFHGSQCWIVTRSSKASRWCKTSSSLGRRCRFSPMSCSRPRKAASD